MGHNKQATLKVAEDDRPISMSIELAATFQNTTQIDVSGSLKPDRARWPFY